MTECKNNEERGRVEEWEDWSVQGWHVANENSYGIATPWSVFWEAGVRIDRLIDTDRQVIFDR